MIESLRAWLESIRAWVLSRPEFSFLHDWIATTPASMIWLVVVVFIVALILAIGFWPPLKPLPEEKAKEPAANGED